MKKLTSFLTVFLLLSSTAAFAKKVTTKPMRIMHKNQLDCKRSKEGFDILSKIVRGLSIKSSCNPQNADLKLKMKFKYLLTADKFIDIQIGSTLPKWSGYKLNMSALGYTNKKKCEKLASNLYLLKLTYKNVLRTDIRCITNVVERYEAEAGHFNSSIRGWLYFK